ncbi:MAG: flagellar basal body P-ring formation chaperone FlgA [Pseudomonadota bacterium]
MRVFVFLSLLLIGFSGTAAAESLFAGRNIAAGELINEGDLINGEGVVAAASRFFGLEARRTVYKGQPVNIANFQSPTLVKRNAIVRMEYLQGALKITTEGRALDEGGSGDLVRIMNLGSRQTVTARVIGADTVRVGR